MNLLILPGNVLSNKKWNNRVVKSFKCISKNILAIEYDHWKNHNESINIDSELSKIISFVNIETAIIAKSAGVVLASKGIYENKITVKKCVFLGTPLAWAKNNGLDLDSWLSSNKMPEILFIQQKNDPLTNYSEMKKFIASKKINCSLVEIEGDDHKYENLNQVIPLIKKFISSNSQFC